VYKRQGIGIAVIDSGVNLHNDLRDNACANGGYRVAVQETFVPTDKVGSTPYDAYGHGTHVAGIIAGNGKCTADNIPTMRFIGVAPQATMISLRVLDDTGRGTDSAVIRAIDRAIQLQAQHNIRVINLSLGRRVFESYKLDPLCQAAERSWKAGIVVVVAAGNQGRTNAISDIRGRQYTINGYGTIGSPANDPFVITVGATRDMGTATKADDVMASYSSKGPTAVDRIAKPDLVAPGNRIFSTKSFGKMVGISIFKPDLETRFPANVFSRSGFYIELSGTSMAAPMVSGAAALLVQKFGPAITPDAIKGKLMKSAAKTFPAVSTFGTQIIQNDLFTVGAGYLDVMAALNNPDGAPAGKLALSPTASYTCGASGGTGCVRISHAAESLFTTASSAALWGNQAVWGGSVLWGDSVLWGCLLYTSPSPRDV
jgi:serine protease AprX